MGEGPLLCDGRRGHRAGRESRDLVVLSARPATERQQIWRGIKRSDPPLAALLRDDPVIKQLRKRFGATPVLTAAERRRYLEAAEENHDEQP